jgi:prevent-host-death family protein
MPHIGIRELKTRASEIMRQVRDRHARYVITYRGQPVGLLLPLEEAEVEARLLDEAPTADPWAELEALGQEIGAGWQSPQTGAEILADMRR